MLQIRGGSRTRPTVLEIQNLSYDVPELQKLRRSPDFEALKL